MTEVKKAKSKNTRSTKEKKQPELFLETEIITPETEPVTPIIPASVNLSHYISNLEKPVYAISGLPEEFIATLFAWVSRSPKSFKQHLEEALRDQDVETSLGSFQALDEKAKAFHEKWTVGFGHSSVAEHAVVHVGIEEVSRLASAELALANDFLSITEYSQRYQKPVRGAWVNPLQPDQPLYEEVEAFYNRAFDAFESLIESLYGYRCGEEELDPNEKGKRQSEIQKLAYEDARYVLPLAMHTQLGVTANARTWRDAISALGASMYPESQALAKDLKEEISKVTPVLLKHATPSAYQVNSAKRLALQEQVSLRAANSDQTVRLLATETEENVLRKLTALLYLQYQDHGYTDAFYHASVFQNTIDREAWLKLSLHELGEHDMAPSVFKHVTYQASLLISEANWHQLLRHNRQTDFTYGNPSVRHGYVVPPMITQAKQGNLVKEIAQASEKLYTKLEEVYGKQVASYVVANAHRRPIAMTFSLWEAYHLINLRTSSEAQWEIKDTMELLYRQLQTVHPALLTHAKRRE